MIRVGWNSVSIGAGEWVYFRLWRVHFAVRVKAP